MVDQVTDQKEKTIRIEFDIPGPDAPGYLRRQREALGFANAMMSNPTQEDLDKMVEFLAQFVTVPLEQEAKIEALWEASENQFMQLLRAVAGQSDENPTQ